MQITYTESVCFGLCSLIPLGKIMTTKVSSKYFLQSSSAVCHPHSSGAQLSQKVIAVYYRDSTAMTKITMRSFAQHQDG